MALHLSRVKFRPLIWRNTHPYILADRREDLTQPQLVFENPNCDRDVALYGFVRGTHFRQGGVVHLLGGGDFEIDDVKRLPDPCPLLDSSDSNSNGTAMPSKTTLKTKKVLIYAPLADVGGIKMDEDAMYIDIGRVNYTKKSSLLVTKAAKGMGDTCSDSGSEDDSNESSIEGEETLSSTMLKNLQDVKVGVDRKLQESKMKLFSMGKAVRAGDVEQKQLMEGHSESNESGESDSGGNGFNGADTTNATYWDQDNEEEESDYGGDNNSSEGDEEEEGEETLSHNASGGGLGNGNDLGEPPSTSSAVEKWRDGIAARAASRFLERARSNINLMELVYGSAHSSSSHDHQRMIESRGQRAVTGSDDIEDELFQLKKNKKYTKSPPLMAEEDETTTNATIQDFDSSKVPRDEVLLLQDKESESLKDFDENGLRNRFVTGNWGANAKNGRAEEEGHGMTEDNFGSDDGSELYGSYEDLETGEKFDGTCLISGAISEQPEHQPLGSIKDQRAINAAKKAAVMAAKEDEEAQIGDDEEENGINNSYNNTEDNNGGRGEEQEGPFLAEARKARATQSYRNRIEFASEKDERRAVFEGHRLGHYVRIKLKGIPASLVRGCFSNPGIPLVIGGLLTQEMGMGMIRCRVKRHRWSPGILKSNDPIVVSVGWRRFQTMPIYAMEDNDGRHKFLKYTPEHMHCICVFHGPVCPPTTGIMAMQHVGSKAGSALGSFKGQRFGISLTGTLLELDAYMKVVKKLKLVGHPQKIYKKTAFISGMFNSDVEASRFEGAALRTVSGVRGAVKKVVQGGGGTFRSTFEDRLLMSDIVFLRLWVPIEPVHYYNPVTSLLGEEFEWRGVKTTAVLRREHGVPVPINKDSLYKPDASEREIRRFNPLPVPESLSKALPFANKPKLQAKRRGNVVSSQDGPKKKYLVQRTVVLEPREKQKVALMQAISTIRNEKVQIRKAAASRRRDEQLKAQERKDKAFSPLTAHRKKVMYRDMGQKQAAEARQRG